MGCKGVQEGRSRGHPDVPTKQGEKTTPAAIIIKNFPPDVGVNSNYVELITQAVAHQIVYAMEATPRVETDCQGILKYAQKELTKGSQRSMKTQTIASCYRVLRKVARARRRLRREQGQETNLQMNAGEQKSMHSTMIALWVKSIEFAIITWRTRGFLRATPDAILSWYGRGEITAHMVKGVFEHQFTSIKETSKEY
jgi:hypothetical protein